MKWSGSVAPVAISGPFLVSRRTVVAAGVPAGRSGAMTSTARAPCAPGGATCTCRIGPKPGRGFKKLQPATASATTTSTIEIRFTFEASPPVRKVRIVERR